MWSTLTRYKCAINNKHLYIRWLYPLGSQYRGNYFNYKSSQSNNIYNTFPKSQAPPTIYLPLFYFTFWYPKLNFLSNHVTTLNWKANIHIFFNTIPNTIKTNISHKIIRKLNLNEIVPLGYYSGLIIQRINVGNTLLAHQHTSYCKTIVNQLLDNLHSLYIRSYNGESLKTQDIESDHICTVIPESFIEFEIPKIDITYVNEGQSNISSENLLIHLRSVMVSIDKLQSNVKKIVRHCGYLPIEHCQYKNKNNQIRIYFPNKTVMATKILISDLGIKEGTVYECPNADNISFKANQHPTFYHMGNKINDNNGNYDDDILSSSCNESFDSIDSDLVLLSSLSPILSQQSIQSI